MRLFDETGAPMFRTSDHARAEFFACALVLAALVAPESASAREALLYSFKGGSDGSFPEAGVIRDASGNLYGTTYYGGGTGCGGKGCGIVFKLAPDGTETVLHVFQGGTDGAGPEARLVADASGNLYGTTGAGGAANAGTVFEITTDRTETILYSFCSEKNCADGNFPYASLLRDGQGNLYGITGGGGDTSCGFGCGVVFELAPGGAETVLYAFKGAGDGVWPVALVMDGSGNLFGTTLEGGADREDCQQMTLFYGCGIAFEIPRSGTKKTLYDFCSQPRCSDGWAPGNDLVMDARGNLFGATCCAVYGNVVYKLAPDGTETVLHTFTDHPDGVSPLGGLVLDGKGNLYGATLQGGTGGGCRGQIGCGTVFKISRHGRESILYSFQGGIHGGLPYGGVIADSRGNLYGTTSGGGEQFSGTVFEIAK